MIYRYIYKITCTAGSLKDKFYFGQHTTENLNDNYKGSGVILQKYYKKYNKNYIKEIISFHNTQDELNKAEYDIIHPYLNDVNCLNLKDGGNQGSLSELTKIKISKSHIGKISPNKGQKMTDEQKIKISKGRKGKKCGKEHPYYGGMPQHIVNKISASNRGKKRSEETKKKFSEIHKGQTAWNKGIKCQPMSIEAKKKLSQTNTGKKFLTDGINTYFISSEYWGELIDIGFKFGMSPRK